MAKKADVKMKKAAAKPVEKVKSAKKSPAPVASKADNMPRKIIKPPKPVYIPKSKSPPRAPTKLEKPKPLTAKERTDFRTRLLRLRDELSGQVTSLKGESLKREDAIDLAEDGSDAFDRQFALTLASAEQDSIFEIDEALRRIDSGTFGACEECTGAIGFTRLHALPFVRACINCQSELEKSKPKFRAG